MHVCLCAVDMAFCICSCNMMLCVVFEEALCQATIYAQ